jgi:flagellar biosynthesis/type III secretory pathway protein FliH
MPDETPTLAPPETPIPVEAPVPETVTPEPPETAAPAEGVEESVEPTVEAAAWAEIPKDNAEDLFEIDEVKAIHTRGIQDAHDTAYSEVQGHMQPAIQANKQALDQISTATETIMTTLNRAAEDGALDKRTVEDLFRTHRSEFAALNQQYQSIGYWEGVKQYITALLGADAPTFTTRLERMQQNVPDPTFATDMQKKLRTQGRQEGYDEGFKKGLKEGKNAGAAQTAIKANKGKGANLAPGTPAGGRSEAERLLDPKTPTSELREIRARQKASR